MGTFVEAVQRAQSLWEPEIAQEPEMRTYGTEPERLREAQAGVEACAERFANAELAGRDALGRTGPVKFFPPLGDYLRKELAKADEATVAGVRDAILTAVAIGYVGLAMFEVRNPKWRLRDDRTARQIWDFWVPRLNVGFLDKAGMPADSLSFFREFGGRVLIRDLGEIGIGGFGKKGRLKAIGAFHCQAGAMLRASQTDLADHNMVVSSPAASPFSNQWDFDAYA